MRQNTGLQDHRVWAAVSRFIPERFHAPGLDHIVGYIREELTAGLVNRAAMRPTEYADLDWRGLEKVIAKGICTPFENGIPPQGWSTRVASFVCGNFSGQPGRSRVPVSGDAQACRPQRIVVMTAPMLGEHLRASRFAYAAVEKEGQRFTIRQDYTDGRVSTEGNYQLSLLLPRAVATINRAQPLIIRNVGAELLPSGGADMF
jgi:hypothetical protein